MRTDTSMSIRVGFLSLIFQSSCLHVMVCLKLKIIILELSGFLSPVCKGLLRLKETEWEIRQSESLKLITTDNIAFETSNIAFETLNIAVDTKRFTTNDKQFQQ